MNKITTIIGLSFAVFFLIGLATTLTRSMMIGFIDVIPVYLLMGAAIAMMIYEAFFDKNKFLQKLRNLNIIIFPLSLLLMKQIQK